MAGQGATTNLRRRRSLRDAARSFWSDARRDLRRDLDDGRGFLWWPVVVGVGEAGYLSLADEPSLSAVAAAVALVLALGLAVRLRTGRIAVPLGLLILLVVGVGLAKVSVERVAAPRLSAQRTVALDGVVLAVEDRASRGARLLLKPLAIDPPPREGLPERVRLTVRTGPDVPSPGDGIRVRARIGPPPGPLIPGGYDFARTAYFQRIGGSGFGLGAAVPLAAIPAPSRPDSLLIAVGRFRQAVSRHIRSVLPGDTGAIAAALMVGDRGAIDPRTDAAMRTSGLSHVLSISGLHMALVAACLFAGVRVAGALVPPVAARWPVKKIAAAVALVGTLAYFVVSGMEVPTERSAIMVGMSLTAILLDRRALSLRVVALAALVALVLQPAAVLDPGAQMSFAAVVGLIAGFEVVADRLTPSDGGDVNRLVRLLRAGIRWIGLSLLTSLVAGLATAPIALHHFNRIAPFGLVSNLLATPLVSVLIMPGAVVAALAMPFGLDRPALLAMGVGIDGMVRIADVVASWTPGGGALGQPRLAGTLLVVAGGLWLALWRGRQRLLGVPALVLGLIAVPGPRPFDLVVSGDGRGALVIRDDGTPALVGRPDDFEASLWLAALGAAADPDDAALARGTACDRDACVLFDGNPAGIARASVVLRPVAFADECAAARLIVTPLVAPPWCAARTTVVDGPALRATGARTYRFVAKGGGGLSLQGLDQALPSGRRPWTGGR